ncbi:YhgE/Pip domain-containing protein [Pueribacillus theae]|uniref:YhgE/Pip domain-containing protein n=1 Tax=Pueribacillus theae TaxID=2171751 RepID=UPI001981C039|nr:YhgE/Pip domain-containing protein [Pueribacillus theae]
MKSIWRIYGHDMKSVGTNWVAAILIGGLIILPSLYAWFNIKASWDPYGQTDQMPVGVVNEDKGATIRDNDINAGDELVRTLKENDSMDWHFDKREKAMDKVEYGDYFAVIIIPENFSEQLATVVSDRPEKAEVDYFVNEKINAIAPKITEKGASTIVEQITSNFISTVNGVIFDIFNELGIELEKDLPDIRRFEDYVFKAEESLPEINQLLSESNSDAKHARDIIDKAQGMIPKAEQTTKQGLQTINETTAFLNKAEKRLNDLAPKVENDLKKAQTIAKDVNNFIQGVNTANIDFSAGEEIKKQLNERAGKAIAQINSVEQALNQLKELNNQRPVTPPPAVESPEEGDGTAGQQTSPQGSGSTAAEQKNKQEQNQKIDEAIANLNQLKSALETIQTDAKKIDTFIGEKKQEVDKVIGDLQKLSGNTVNKIDAFMKEYKENIEPTVIKEIKSAKSTLASAKEMLTGIQSTIPEVEKILNRTEKNLGEGQDMLKYLLGEYPYINDKIRELANKIREVQGETDINEIIELLRNDPEAERGFFAEPVKLNKNQIFPVANYGTGMTPFYTVLAIWVGSLLLISLLAADVHEVEEFSARQRYIGKLLTFVTIGLLQTLVVTIGDIFIINVPIVHPVWFVLFGLFISLIFMLIVYTLVSIFGDVGKAMAIVLLVLQIAGSGGTYPVVLLPQFFQMIHPFLPFTYAVDVMREAVSGIVWSRVIRDLLALAIFGFIFLMLGIFLKEPINKKTDALMKKSRKTGLFH